MTCHYPDLGSASDWLNQISHAARPIRSTTQIWVVTRHQYGLSELVSQTLFGGETSGSVAKCRLFSQTRRREAITVFFRAPYFELLSCWQASNRGTRTWFSMLVANRLFFLSGLSTEWSLYSCQLLSQLAWHLPHFTLEFSINSANCVAVYYWFYSKIIALEFSLEFPNPEFVLFVILLVFERNELKIHTHPPKWTPDPWTSILVSRYLILDSDNPVKPIGHPHNLFVFLNRCNFMVNVLYLSFASFVAAYR